MSNQDRWQPLVYIITDETAKYRYWALASYKDGTRTRYSRCGQYARFADAAIAARDMSRMYNSNELTPQQEGTTFAKSKLPRGSFADENKMTEFYAAQDKRVQTFLSAMDDIANGVRKPK